MGDEILLKRISDLHILCDKYAAPRFSDFLDARQQALLKKEGVAGGTLFGGYNNAERCVLGIFPDWYEEDYEIFPIRVLKVTKKYDKDITHRNYLGTILSFGIKREKVGDILTDSQGAYIFLAEDIAEFVKDNLHKVAGCGVHTEFVDFSRIDIPDRKFEYIDTVAASQRLDAILSSILKISRNDAKAMIMSGKISLNHFEERKADCYVEEGDLLSIRGFGRVELFLVGGKTRSDRLHIKLKKYI